MNVIKVRQVKLLFTVTSVIVCLNGVTEFRSLFWYNSPYNYVELLYFPLFISVKKVCQISF